VSHTSLLDRAFDVPTHGATAVLDAADQSFAKLQNAQFTASFAPAITTYAQCSCGSVFEIHGGQINATGEEKAAASEAAADYFGAAHVDTVYAGLVARVIDVINHERASADYDALRDWEDAHAECESAS
jgi:hypothetical protein